MNPSRHRNHPVPWLLLALMVVTGCASKHVVHHLETTRTDAGVTLNSPPNLASGTFFALPRTVVTVTVPVEKTEVDFGNFWHEFTDEVVAGQLGRLFADAGLPRRSRDTTTRKKVAALEAVARRSLFRVLEQPIDSLQVATRKIANDTHFVGILTRNQFADSTAVRLVASWSTALDSTDLRPPHKALYKFIGEQLDHRGLKLSYPAAGTYRVKTASVETGFETDPDQVYFIEIEGQCLVDRSLKLTLTEDGVIASSESHAVDQTLDTAVQVLETAAGIAGRFFIPFAPPLTIASPDTLASIKRAKGFLQDIDSSRDARRLLMGGIGDFWAGQGTPSELKNLLAELTKAEQSLTRHFDNTVKKPWPARFAFRPGHAPAEVELFGLSANGVVFPATNYLVGLPKKGYVGTGTARSTLVLRWEDMAPGDADQGHGRTIAAIHTQVDKDQNELELTEFGYPYRIPYSLTAVVTERTSKASKDLSATLLTVAQFGEVFRLPSSTGDPDLKLTVAYYHETGALKEVFVDAHAADLAPAIKTLGTAAGNLIDARQEEELNALRRRKEKLELEKAIRSLRDEAASTP